MELKQFVKQALTEIIEAVDEVSESATHETFLYNTDGSRSVEFDIAVSASDTSAGQMGAGIRVLQFIEIGGDKTNETTNTTVSRVKFGVMVRVSKKNESGVGMVKRRVD